MTNANIYFAPEFVAQGGGPEWNGGTIHPTQLIDSDSATVALLFDQNTRTWIIADAEGHIFAEALDPGELTGWMTTYMSALSREIKAMGV